MLLFIVPVFKGIYKELHGKLPAPTLLLVTISDITVKFFPIVLVVVVVRRHRLAPLRPDPERTSPVGHDQIESTRLRSVDAEDRPVAVLLQPSPPYSRPVCRSWKRWRSLATTVGNMVVVKGIDAIIDSVKRGEPMARSLAASPRLPGDDEPHDECGRGDRQP